MAGVQEPIDVWRAAEMAALSEKQFMATVIEYAHLCNWRVYHPFDSRRSAPGWPDLALVRGDTLLLLELKREKGKVTPAQTDWLAALGMVQVVQVGVFRPSQMDDLARLLGPREG